MVVVAVNIVLRPLGRIVDRRPETGGETPSTYTFLAVTRDDAEAHVRTLLVHALSRTDFALRSVESQNVTDGQVRVQALLSAEERETSETRRRIQVVVDACAAEITRRYREGEAAVEDLLPSDQGG